MNKSKYMAVRSVLLLILVVPVAFATPLLEVNNIRQNKIYSIGFELLKPALLNIDAVGIQSRYSEDMNALAWIIDSQTRQPVWVMSASETDRVRGEKNLRSISTQKLFKAGKYELYYYAGDFMFGSVSIRGTGDFFDFLSDLLGSKRYIEFDRLLEKCNVRISSSELDKSDIRVFPVDGEIDNAVIVVNKLGDSEYIQKAFHIERPIDLRIYSVYENPGGWDSPADYGWIIDAKTRVKIWETSRWNSRWAGGGEKNRKIDEVVHFEKGDYILFFVTDDSHSYPDFNIQPPYDPINWGITLALTNSADKANFSLQPLPEKKQALVEFTRVRNNEFFEQRFKITRDCAIYVYAIGEMDSRKEFADYGWIQDAVSGRIVWEMTALNTEHAGGSRKNRMFDSEINLPAGEYTLFYVSDDSHSYDDWNDSPPFDPNSWGITLYPGKEYRAGDFVKISAADKTTGSNILVKMVGVKDDEHRRETFILKKQSRLHIYAIGEGDSDDMYDYGWIIDKLTGRSVWEMTWRNTEPAGGARKNRMFNDDIILDQGTYEVHYRSDGSHSFGDWNAPRPRDPYSWGITISIVE